MFSKSNYSRILRSFSLVLILAVMAGSLAGCLVLRININSKPTTTSTPSTPSTTTDPLNERYVWQGRVLSIEGERAFLASVDQPYQNMLGDKAHVGLYDDARVLNNYTGEPISLLDVPVGSPVIVTITGGIRESYPVQVSAVEVRVILFLN